MTSERKWRRVLGPIVLRPWESWPFLLAAVCGSVWPLFYLGSAFWAALGFIRLIRRHLRLRFASDHIQKSTQEAQATRAILFRLTDEEIKLFSKHISIELFAEKQTCLRWRVIRNYLRGDVWRKKSS
jgi:hypothetical protein